MSNDKRAGTVITRGHEANEWEHLVAAKASRYWPEWGSLTVKAVTVNHSAPTWWVELTVHVSMADHYIVSIDGRVEIPDDSLREQRDEWETTLVGTWVRFDDATPEAEARTLREWIDGHPNATIEERAKAIRDTINRLKQTYSEFDIFDAMGRVDAMEHAGRGTFPAVYGPTEGQRLANDVAADRVAQLADRTREADHGAPRPVTLEQSEAWSAAVKVRLAELERSRRLPVQQDDETTDGCEDVP